MRAAFNKEILRSITHSWSRFAAIFAIVALGAGFYAGLRMAAPNMRLTIDRYLDGTAFMDVHLISTLGLSDADVDAVRQVRGVAAVMPTHVADATATVADRRATMRIHGLDVSAGVGLAPDATHLNRPVLVEGRWPERAGECVIDRSRFYETSAQIGERVVLTAGTRALEDTFVRTDFAVVGVVDSSQYLSFTRGSTTLADGNIDRFMYIPNADFVDHDTYTDLFAVVEGAAGVSTFTSEYDDIVAPVASALEALAPRRQAARLAEVRATAQRKLDEKRAEYERARVDAEAQLARAAAELDAAADEIASAESDLAVWQARYDRGLASLAAERRTFAAQFAEAQRLIDAGRAAADAQQVQLDQLAAALPAIQGQVAALTTSVANLQAAYDAAVVEEALGHVVSPSAAELAVLLADAEGQLLAAKQVYAEQSATHAGGAAALTAARAELDARQAQLDAGRQQAQAEFAAAQRSVDAAKRQLASGRAELAEGMQALADGRAGYEEQKAAVEIELADGRAAIDDAQAEIDAIAPPEWYVLGRGTNLGYASFSADSDRIEAISVVFPFIFFLVAALVALTTMTRMVDEERTLIGTYIAIGYSKARIAAKYLVYAGLASILGSTVGVLAGSQILPVTVWRAYTTMYTAPAIATPINVPLALTAALASVGVTLLATFLAVQTSLREAPAALMLPRAPRPGKRILLERIGPVWSRLSFSHKVTARNLFRYKKRLLMTVIGIAGCTALLLTGFGLRDSIGDVLDKQYGNIYAYDTTVGFDTDAGATVESLVDDPGLSDALIVHMGSIRVHKREGVESGSGLNGSTPVSGFGFGSASAGSGGDSLDLYVCVPSDTARLVDFISLRVRKSESPVVLDDTGVVITEKAARTLDVRVGDSVRVERFGSDSDLGGVTTAVLPVAGITEQYVSHYIYISPTLYEASFGEPPAYNQVLGKAAVAGDEARERLSRSLLEQDGVTTVQFTDDITSSFDDMLESLNAVVFILIFSAGMLAFIVLYNLTNINVTERTREIATIKVLGFYDTEVNAYIYRETAALTVLGCAIGLLMGIGLEAFVIITAEIDIVMFGREIHPLSYAYSAALTLVFAVVVNLAMQPRLRGIDMVESLKSVE